MTKQSACLLFLLSCITSTTQPSEKELKVSHGYHASSRTLMEPEEQYNEPYLHYLKDNGFNNVEAAYSFVTNRSTILQTFLLKVLANIVVSYAATVCVGPSATCCDNLTCPNKQKTVIRTYITPYSLVFDATTNTLILGGYKEPLIFSPGQRLSFNDYSGRTLHSITCIDLSNKVDPNKHVSTVSGWTVKEYAIDPYNVGRFCNAQHPEVFYQKRGNVGTLGNRAFLTWVGEDGPVLPFSIDTGEEISYYEGLNENDYKDYLLLFWAGVCKEQNMSKARLYQRLQSDMVLRDALLDSANYAWEHELQPSYNRLISDCIGYDVLDGFITAQPKKTVLLYQKQQEIRGTFFNSQKEDAVNAKDEPNSNRFSLGTVYDAVPTITKRNSVLAVDNKDNFITLWTFNNKNTWDKEVLHKITEQQRHDGIRDASVSATGNFCALVHTNPHLLTCIHAFHQQQPGASSAHWTKKFASPITVIRCSPQENFIGVGLQNGQLFVYTTQQEVVFQTCMPNSTGYPTYPTALAFSDTADRLFVGCENGGVREHVLRNRKVVSKGGANLSVSPVVPESPIVSDLNHLQTQHGQTSSAQPSAFHAAIKKLTIAAFSAASTVIAYLMYTRVR